MHDHPILCRGVTKAFGAHRVLDGLDLAVPRGSVFAFLGNNGAGKSTLIRLITGLLAPDAGTIAVLGRDLRRERRAVLSRIGVIVDAPVFYPNLTAAEFLGLTCVVKGLPRSECARVLELVDLAATGARLIGRFSLGMKQRLALANALLGKPELLLLDEPTNGLDPEGMLAMRRLITELPARCGCTVFVSSHLLDEVEKMATHVALLRAGRIQSQAALADLVGAGQGELHLDVDDAARAAAVLDGYVTETLGQGALRVRDVERQRADRVHALLVQGGVALYQSVHRRPSLEQWFMEAHRA